MALSIITIANTEISALLTRNDLLVLRATMKGNKPAANPAHLGETIKAVADEMKISREDARAKLEAYVNTTLEMEFAPVPAARLVNAMGIYASATSH